MPTTEIVPKDLHLPSPQVEPESPKLAVGLPKPTRRPSTKLVLAASALIFVLLGIVVWNYYAKSQKATYTLAPVDRGDVESSITATGNCNAVVTVQVGSQVSGNIIALYADFNTKVKKDDLVARIDPAIFQARVDQAKANLDSAKAAVVTARATLKKAESDIANAEANISTQKANVVRARSAVTDAKLKNDRRVKLVEEGVISAEDADTARATYDQAVATLDATNADVNAAVAAKASAEAQREVAQTQLDGAQAIVNQDAAALQQAQLDLIHTEIRAPVDGTVVSRNMDVGQTVAASFQAPTIFLIAQDLTKMQVDTNVDESDVGPVRVGQQASFTVDAYPGVVFPGVVAQIRQAPINVQNVITYDVVVQVENRELKLFPGMTANVRILTGRAPGALRIPVAALRFHPPGAAAARMKGGSPQKSTQPKSTVYILDGHGQPKPIRVKLGLSDGNYSEVLDGLTEGQRIVIAAAGKPGSPAAQPVSPGGTRRIGF